MTVRSRAFSGLGLLATLTLSITAAAQQPSAEKQNSLQPEQELIRQGRFAEAKALTLRELQRLPPSPDAYNLLGIIDSEQQDYPSALDAFHKALQLAPKSTAAHNNLGNVYLAQKKFDLAETEFRAVLRIEPANPDANYKLGALLIARGSPAQAIAPLERVHPRTAETTLDLIRALLQTQRIPEAMRLAEELSAQKKNDAKLHLSLGLLLASEKQDKAGQLELERADALQPDNYEILNSLGQAALRNGDNIHAELALSRALKLRPDSTETQYLLAQAYANESRPLDALDLLVRANRAAPDNPDILYLMAKISISQKFYEDAIPLLEKALKIAPLRPDLHAALGEAYFKSDKIDQSLKEFQQVIAISPSVQAYSFLGLAHTYFGRFDEAKEDFQNGLKLDPDNSFCLFHLGYIAKLQGDSANAAATFEKILKSNPQYPYALLELANIRMEAKQYSEAADLLRRYVRISSTPAVGYYKLSMAEKYLHQADAAKRDLAQFQSLSKDSAASLSHPYDDLFEYLNTRSKLAPQARVQQDISTLLEQSKLHPDQPEVLYALTEAYLKAGKIDEARSTLAQLDKQRPADARTLTGSGVLLARYGLYDEAIQHFQAALQAQPNSDDIAFDLADACFRKGLYADALSAAMQVSEPGRNDEAYLALLADIYAHQGDKARAAEIYQRAIDRNPDNDQDYLSLALLQFSEANIAAAKQTLLKGQSRVPGSGKIMWGLGLAAALQGDTAAAAQQLERAVELLPEWPGSYSTLGVFYYQTGQLDKAREVLDRFKNSSVRGGLDVNRIEATLAQTPATAPTGDEPLSNTKRLQLLQLALYLADKTL